MRRWYHRGISNFNYAENWFEIKQIPKNTSVGFQVCKSIDYSAGLGVIDVQHTVEVIDLVFQQSGGRTLCIEDVFPVVQSQVPDPYIIGAFDHLAAMLRQRHAVLLAFMGSLFFQDLRIDYCPHLPVKAAHDKALLKADLRRGQPFIKRCVEKEFKRRLKPQCVDHRIGHGDDPVINPVDRR